ncbi:MAG TPA: hypothetical protein VJM09_03510 [Sphingobium sp.]|nr:hypothetical protein [Sphingobium sp.]
MGDISSPAPVRGSRGNDLPAYVGNGLIGLRVREVALLAGSAIVNGVVGLYPKAAMAGDRRLALDLFEEGYAAYDKGRFHQCLEYREDHPDSKVPAGPFMANIGGMLMTMLMGLPGLQIAGGDPAAWPIRPVVLPTGWNSISVERLWAGGRPMRLIAEHGAERARLLPL